MRMGAHVTSVTVKGQRRLFFTVKKLNERIAADSTEQEFLAVNSSLKPVRLKITLIRDKNGFVANVEGEETPVDPREYDLALEKVVLIVERFLQGDFY